MDMECTASDALHKEETNNTGTPIVPRQRFAYKPTDTVSCLIVAILQSYIATFDFSIDALQANGCSCLTASNDTRATWLRELIHFLETPAM
ncbi:hypothetical protein SLS58_009215 [Diplodia intermedia]|uniref:Uncharacterized protein n=1 Tax=Diplodia intermedia TaxID=856260 RepID=A0ABR3TDQ6_9PEZI